MWHFTFTSRRTALAYIAGGAVTMIWAGVWYIYWYDNQPIAQTAYYWCGVFLATGLTLVGIGCGLGMINRSATGPTDRPRRFLWPPRLPHRRWTLQVVRSLRRRRNRLSAG